MIGGYLIEKAILAALQLPQTLDWEFEESLEELALLAEAAGAEVLGIVTQKKESPESGLYFGRGKVDEIRTFAENQKATLVLVDDELTATQSRNLEDFLGIRVVDRTQLILDIFAQRAASREGKLQVELAQLRYLLPRLTGKGSELSRLGGGIGTRGPGETKLEVDRRRIRKRIADLEEELEEVMRQRETQRRARKKADIPVVALVGYTNAGKSTLLNALTDSEVYVADRLFATLDPTARRIELPSRQALLVDTVGFVRKLPHHLVAAFRATLEEVRTADALVHVIDGSSPGAEEQYDAVCEVLEELGALGKPTVCVFNKMDMVKDGPRPAVNSVASIAGYNPGCIQGEKNSKCGPVVMISARDKTGLDLLRKAIEDVLPDPIVCREFVLPYSDAGVVSMLHEQGWVTGEEYKDDGIRVEARVPLSLANKLERYRT